MLMGNFILLPTKKEKQGAELMQPKEITYAQCVTIDRNQDFRNDILIRGRGQVYQKNIISQRKGQTARLLD